MGLVTLQSFLGYCKAQDQNSNCTGAFLHRAMAYGVKNKCVYPTDPGILARLEEVSTGAGCLESIWHPKQLLSRWFPCLPSRCAPSEK